MMNSRQKLVIITVELRHRAATGLIRSGLADGSRHGVQPLDQVLPALLGPEAAEALPFIRRL